MGSDLPLGKQVDSPQRYWPEILTAIPRSKGRAELDLEAIPFQGWDRWIAWEFAWNSRKNGRQVGILDMLVPSCSQAIFESKSLKLYLNSFFYREFDDMAAMLDELQQRLSTICEMLVQVRYRSLDEANGDLHIQQPGGICLDHLATEVREAAPLGVERKCIGERRLYWSHLFRSLCPVTGQPDWATVLVETSGVELDQKGLLGYLLGFADHQGFHESCAEHIFMDIWRQCVPEALAVTARFTRRGGIEINPYRTSSEALQEQNFRQLRQ